MIIISIIIIIIIIIIINNIIIIIIISFSVTFWFLCNIGRILQNREKILPPFRPPHHKGLGVRKPPSKSVWKNGG